MTFHGLDLLGADALDDVRAGSVLKRGSKGEAVKAVQALLGVDADGEFGGKTEAAVKAFQISRGLSVDGKVGRDTLAALEKSPGVTRVDFAEDEVITAARPALPVPSAGGQSAAKVAPSPAAAVPAEDTKKRNLMIALGLGALGAAGLAVAWKR